MIYLDEASTTKPKRDVLEVMIPYMVSSWNNPSSLYKPSTVVKKDIEESRSVIANYINAESEEIVFTSGGSESNSMAIQGFVNYWKDNGYTPVVVTSTIEHKSILDCVSNTVENCHFVKVDGKGVLNLFDLDTILKIESADKHNKILVSIMWANNEIGTIQDIQSISSIAHKYGAIFHTDAVQIFPDRFIDVKESGIDMMSVSGHKFGMLKGSGFLYKKKDVKIKPLIYGSQENGFRGGTENISYIIGLKTAVKLLSKDLKLRSQKSDKIHILRDMFIVKLMDIGCRLNGDYKNRLSNNISIILPEGVSGEAFIYMMDANDIYISAGSACNSHSQNTSHVLEAIGLSKEEALRTIRITIPNNITVNDVDYVISEFKKAIKILRQDDLD